MKAYLFDLDGTLTDSRAGLFPAFRSGLGAIGIDAVGDLELNAFLGTPLPKLFRTFRPDLTQTDIDTGIAAFRSKYAEVGIVENQLYPGVIEMLGSIKRLGAQAWVVTSKPEFQALQVVAHLKLDVFLSGLVGAGLAENDTKTELVARALAAGRLAPQDAVMVGDRHYDIIGALENGVLPVGVLWGYGSQDELRSAGCRDFVRTPDDFRSTFVEAGKDATALRRVAGV